RMPPKRRGRSRAAPARASERENRRISGQRQVELVAYRPRRGGGFLERDDLPRTAILQQHAQDLIVERVARLVRRIGGEQRVTAEVEVADRVEHLVLDELV